jgi:nucleotide-binding universal stress UspA family protein
MALAAARTCGSKRVTILRVLTRPDSASPVQALEWELSRSQAEQDLRELVAGLEHFPGEVEPVLTEGRPAEEILCFCERGAVDLLVIASHGRGDTRVGQTGSVTAKVIADSRCSLLVVPSSPDVRGVELGPPSSVLVPLDCSARSECVLPIVRRLGEVLRTEFVILHVVPRPDIPHRLPTGARDHELVDELTRRNEQRAEQYLRTIRDRLVGGGLRARTELLVDVNPARAIEQFVGSSNIDLTLVSAHGSSGRGSEPYGSVARRLLDAADKPLWIVQDLLVGTPESNAALT